MCNGFFLSKVGPPPLEKFSGSAPALIVPVALSRYTMLFSSINIYGFMLFLNSIHTVLFPCTLLLSIIIQIGLSPYTIVIYSFNTYSFLAKHCVVIKFEHKDLSYAVK